MGLKINQEIQVSYSTVLEAEVVFDIARKLLGFTLPHAFESHLLMLQDYCNSKSIRIAMRNNVIHLVADSGYSGIRLNFQEFIEYAAKQ